MKIAVLGYSGAGKSTLARALASALDLPCLHLDQVHWLAGWTVRDREESRRMVQGFLEQNTSWVIDGNYMSLCFQQRLEQADHIVILDFPRLCCLWRAWRRSRRCRGRTRADMTQGCPEKFDWAFARWILWEERSRATREEYRRICRIWPDKVNVCTTDRDAARVLSRLTCGS